MEDVKKALEEAGRILQRALEDVGRTIGDVVKKTMIEPGVKIREENDEVKIEIDMPGLEPGDISLYVSEDGTYIRAEGYRGDRKYNKRLALPFKIDAQNTSAVYKNGVLIISSRKVKGREVRISIE